MPHGTKSRFLTPGNAKGEEPHFREKRLKKPREYLIFHIL
jgi:hypothetical protein